MVGAEALLDEVMHEQGVLLHRVGIGRPAARRVAAIVEGDDVGLGKQFVEIFARRGGVPGIAGKAEDQQAAARGRLRRRDVKADEPFAGRRGELERHRARRRRAGSGDLGGGKEDRGLGEEQDDRDDDVDGHRHEEEQLPPHGALIQLERRPSA
jgi:hypothetical protein